MKPEEFLARLLDYERRVGNLYRALGNHASFPVDLRSFWHRMAEDERHHVAVLERSRHLINLQQAAPQAADSVFHEIDQQVAAAEAAVSHTDLSVDEALRYAMRLESSELNRLDGSWFHTFPPSLSAMLTLLTPEDNVHLQRLVEAVHAFSLDKALHEHATSLWVKHQRTHAIKLTQAARCNQSEENG